jgi:hypothetical protein
MITRKDVVRHSGVFLLSQLFDAYVLTATRPEAPPHIAVAWAQGCHDTNTTPAGTGGAATGNTRITYRFFLYFSGFTTYSRYPDVLWIHWRVTWDRECYMP